MRGGYFFVLTGTLLGKAVYYHVGRSDVSAKPTE